jgi:ABC-type nitrate/sulfonate/bicarbonate transport system permease component
MVAELPTVRERQRLSIHDWLVKRPNLVRIVSVLCFIGLWQYFGRQSNPMFMTYPTAIGNAFISLILSGELVARFAESLISFVTGLALSIGIGIPLGILMGTSRLFEYVVDPYINALNAIPRIALVPVIILWFGLGLKAKIIIVISIAIFPIIINTYAGVRDVRGGLIEVGRVYSATKMQMFAKVILPASLPFIMAGIRLGVGLGIIGMIVAEFFTAINGLGGMIVNYENTFQTDKMFVPVIVVGVMGILLTEVVMFLERRWASWRINERDRE